MKFSHFALPLALVSLAGAPALAQQPTAAPAGTPPSALTTPEAQTSYAIGLNIGANLRSDGIPLDTDAFLKGVKDALAKAQPALTNEQVGALLNKLQTDVDTRRNERMAQLAETNKTQGDAFLEANGAKPGVVTTPSGLQYQILTAGTGPVPKGSDTVVCNYRGTLTDGTEFDSSAQHGGPATLPVGGVIQGWNEALQLMPVGSKWRLVVPSALAYGPRGSGDEIGPNAVLVFEIELLSIATK